MNGLKEEFKIPKIDNKGNVIVNAAGDPVYESYVYCFAEMGIDRKLMGRQFFHLSSKALVNAPRDTEHVQILANRRLEIKAFSAILMKVMPDGKYEMYDPANVELTPYVMSELGKSDEEYAKIERIQADFFSRARLQSTELMVQSNDIMMQSLNIMKEIGEIAEQSGVVGLDQLQTFTRDILQTAANMNSEKLPTINSETSITA